MKAIILYFGKPYSSQEEPEDESFLYLVERVNAIKSMDTVVLSEGNKFDFANVYGEKFPIITAAPEIKTIIHGFQDTRGVSFKKLARLFLELAEIEAEEEEEEEEEEE